MSDKLQFLELHITIQYANMQALSGISGHQAKSPPMAMTEALDKALKIL